MFHHTVNVFLHYLAKYKCKQKLTIITIIWVNEKMLQTNIAMNDLYDTRTCYTHTVYCHIDHSLQCWSEVFFFQFCQNVCYYHYVCIFH